MKVHRLGRTKPKFGIARVRKSDERMALVVLGGNFREEVFVLHCMLELIARY